MINQCAKISKILIIQTAFLGDVILTTGMVRSVSQTFPQAIIDILTIPETKEIFKYNTYINLVLIFNKRNKAKKHLSFFNTIRYIRKNNYNAAISVQGSLSSSLIMYLAGIPVRVGFDRQRLLTHPVPLEKHLHASTRHLKLLTPFTEKKFPQQTELFWSASEEKLSNSIINQYKKNGKYLIGIVPGSVWKNKRWPQDYYIELIKSLREYPCSFFLIGGLSDYTLCEQIEKMTRTNSKNYAGKLSILESAALISKLDLMITNDSAPLHIANAVKTDVIAIFGPTVKDFGFYPFRKNDKLLEVDLYCRPCGKHGGNRCPEGHFRCMLNIKPKIVAQEIINYIDKKSKMS